MPTLLQNAINSALSSDWKNAIAANQKMLSENKEDINSLSRLAHAYVQTGKIDEAKKLYKKILSLDKYNTIAAKNLEKLSGIPKHIKTHIRPKTTTVVSPGQFIEEPGKTKTVSLINVAPAGILSHLNSGENVFFYTKKHSIDVRSDAQIYLGAMPDDLAYRLLRFMKAGYEYKVFVKNATKNSVTIFIRETKRAKRFKSQPSFMNSSLGTRIFILSEKQSDSLEDEDIDAKNQEDLEE